MSLSKEQVKHDRINLGRLVRRLENILSDENWVHGDQQLEEEAWIKVQGIAQKIRYARQLLLNVDYYQELDPQTSSPSPSQQRFLQNMRETLDKLDNIVDRVNQQLDLDAPISYLKLVPLPTKPEEVRAPDIHVADPSPAAELIPSDGIALELHPPPAPPASDPAQDLLPSPLASPPNIPARTSQPAATSSLLSASLQTHEELSNELARMATQLKRNAMHFSDSLDQDKSIVQSASEVLEKNYDAMTTSRVRLRDYTGKSSGTTWMVIGGLIAVAIAWVFMFFIIRLT